MAQIVPQDEVSFAKSPWSCLRDLQPKTM